jgi:hypothetical protein
MFFILSYAMISSMKIYNVFFFQQISLTMSQSFHDVKIFQKRLIGNLENNMNF